MARRSLLAILSSVAVAIDVAVDLSGEASPASRGLPFSGFHCSILGKTNDFRAEFDIFGPETLPAVGVDPTEVVDG